MGTLFCFCSFFLTRLPLAGLLGVGWGRQRTSPVREEGGRSASTALATLPRAAEEVPITVKMTQEAIQALGWE